MLRDPKTVFVCWRVEPSGDTEAGQAPAAGWRWEMRVLDLTGQGEWRHTLAAGAKSRYVGVTPGHTYEFELGRRSGGRWQAVCRTGPVDVPRLDSAAPTPSVGEPRGGPWTAAPGASADKPGGRSSAARVPGLTYESTAQFLGSSYPGGSRAR